MKKSPHHFRMILLAAFGGTLLAILVLLGFSWPGYTATPKHVPIEIVGPAEHSQQVRSMMTASPSTPFDVTIVANRQIAINHLHTRASFGTLILGQQPEILMASGNGPAVSDLIAGLKAQFQTSINRDALEQGRPAPPTVVTTDVVPLRRAGFDLSFVAFPIILSGIIGGVLGSIFIARGWRRAIAVVLYALSTGIAMASILNGLMQVIPGSFIAEAGTIAGSIVAISLLVSGLYSLIGPGGIGVGAIFTLLVASPISGATIPQQFIVGPWGHIGQLLAPGAGATLMRNVAYFPAASNKLSLLVLITWAIIGGAAVCFGRKDGLKEV